MPYVSEKQRAYMHIHLPKIAAKWDAETAGKVEPREKAPARPRKTPGFKAPVSGLRRGGR